MLEKDLGNLLSHPDIARALIILSNAKEDAKKMIPGVSEEAHIARNNLQSELIRKMIDRGDILQVNGKSQTNRNIPECEGNCI